MEIRKAKPDEACSCYHFIEDARAYHKAIGFEQWHPDYPILQTVESDMKNDVGYVFPKTINPLAIAALSQATNPPIK